MEPSEALIVFTKRCSSFPISSKTRPLMGTPPSPFPPSPSLSVVSGSNYRVPFSWEKVAGVPKQQVPKKEGHSHFHSPFRFLPLPPATAPASSLKRLMKTKRPMGKRLGMDPFLAALVQCSKKDDDDKATGQVVSKTRRTFGYVFDCVKLYAFCGGTSTVVSDSLVSSPRRRSRSYGAIKE